MKAINAETGGIASYFIMKGYNRKGCSVVKSWDRIVRSISTCIMVFNPANVEITQFVTFFLVELIKG